MISLDSMGAGVCGALAQLAPVFMVLLVAERVVFTTDGDETLEDLIDDDEVWLGAGRLVVDLLLAGLCAFLTIGALIGIEAEGYTGPFAETMWNLTFALIALVILRWLFLATPLSAVFTGIARAQAKAAFAFAEGVTNGAVAFLADAINAAVQFVFGVISLGTAGRNNSSIEALRRRRRRGNRHGRAHR